jgi:hypothetical protein
MTKDEALDLALKALEIMTQSVKTNDETTKYKAVTKAITAIKQARSASVQEPVAWMSREDYDDYLEESKVTSATVYNYQLDIPLYTTPPVAQRQWVGLTDEQKQTAIWSNGGFGAGASWAEKQLAENNK